MEYNRRQPYFFTSNCPEKNKFKYKPKYRNVPYIKNGSSRFLDSLDSLDSIEKRKPVKT